MNIEHFQNSFVQSVNMRPTFSAAIHSTGPLDFSRNVYLPFVKFVPLIKETLFLSFRISDEVHCNKRNDYCKYVKFVYIVLFWDFNKCESHDSNGVVCILLEKYVQQKEKNLQSYFPH